ncbi:MAG TPA: hypothetical protein DGT21_14370 [Armatimonadetes bacterium]|jgi:hypothetical protein|nr:hypothetical protein [Armatimonadota bacterium]
MRIRGHHLVCTYCFHGSGKETAVEFFGVDNAIPQLLKTLQANPDMEITVATDLDEVCDICPLKRPDGCGRSEDAHAQNEKLRGWDRAILEVLGLREGQTTPARELEVRIRERIPDISVFCTNCTSSSPSGWEEYRKAIAEGLWPDDAG